MRVEKAKIQRVIRDEPAFSQMFISHILARNARVEEESGRSALQLNRKTACASVAAVGQFWKGRPTGANSREDRKLFAEMIGTTRSRVSHFMNKFRQLGFIDYNGHLEVHNSLLSVLLSDQPRTVSLPQ